MSEQSRNNDIQRLQDKIITAVGWGKINDWHSSMFEEFSDKVFHVTGVKLSVPTLKRFFGVVKHEGTPSITTLDALSNYVGFENYRDFKTKTPVTTRKISLKPGRSVYLMIGFAVAIVVVFLISNRNPEVIVNASEFTFSSKVLSREFPNSVVFDFTIPEDIRTDSLHIQQYWDPTRTVTISKEQNQATGIYYYPGYFRAKLMVEGKAVQEHDLFLKSQGWLGSLDYEPVSKYFTPDLQDQSRLNYPDDIQSEVTNASHRLVTSLHYVDDLGDVSGDNFTFETTIRNLYDEKWAVCQYMQLYFLGSSGAMIIPFSKLGCSSDNVLMLNDIYLRGKEHDLSAFSTEFTEPVTLKIQVEDKKVEVFIADKKVYTNQYHDTMGRLVGMRFKFLGLGEVLDFKLQDQNNQLISLD